MQKMTKKSYQELHRVLNVTDLVPRIYIFIISFWDINLFARLKEILSMTLEDIEETKH